MMWPRCLGWGREGASVGCGGGPLWLLLQGTIFVSVWFEHKEGTFEYVQLGHPLRDR